MTSVGLVSQTRKPQTLFNCFWLILPMNWPSCVKLADRSLKQNHQCRRFKSNSFHYIRDTNWGCEHAHYHRYKDVHEELEQLKQTSSKHSIFENNFSTTPDCCHKLLLSICLACDVAARGGRWMQTPKPHNLTYSIYYLSKNTEDALQNSQSSHHWRI